MRKSVARLFYVHTYTCASFFVFLLRHLSLQLLLLIHNVNSTKKGLVFSLVCRYWHRGRPMKWIALYYGPASKLARPGICHAFVFGKIQGLGLLNFDKNIRDSRERRYKLIDTKFDRPKFLPDRAFFKNALQLLNFLSTKSCSCVSCY